MLKVWPMYQVQEAAHRLLTLTTWTFRRVSFIIILNVHFISTFFHEFYVTFLRYCFFCLKLFLYLTSNNTYANYLFLQHSFQLKFYVFNATFFIIKPNCDFEFFYLNNVQLNQIDDKILNILSVFFVSSDQFLICDES